MHRTLASRVAPPLLAATLVLLGSASLGADAMPAAVVRQSTAAVQQASELRGATSAAASAIGVASQALDPADRPSRSATVATLAFVASPTVAPAPKASIPSLPAPVWWTQYRGTNHVWMPTLGVSRSVTFYACSRSTYPANVVYRWGCSGTNNTYLFGHNFGVFSPLYTAWRTGALRKGMPVIYADGSGRTRLYRVVTWRVVQPTDVTWAVASQSVPSLTLQTCANAAGTTRLVVRLVAAAS